MSDFTTLTDQFDYYDEAALCERLTNGVSSSERQVVFLVGSALTAPASPGCAGVPGVDGVIAIIEEEFDQERKLELARSLVGTENRYQEAFRFLLGRRGPQAANDVIRRVVGAARNSTDAQRTGYVLNMSTIDDACRAFDADIAGWALSPGVVALGELATGYVNRFGRTILTTNFDPLIEVSIAALGGTSFRTILHRDGNLGQTDGDGSHVVHLHGYWHGSDTLHTPRQLNQPRPQLRASLAHLIRDRTVVVLAYGGWDDAFTGALVDVVVDDNAYPEIIWCFHEDPPRVRTNLLKMLMPGIDRGRVALYGGIDCHTFLPKLSSAWRDCEPAARAAQLTRVRPEPADEVAISEQGGFTRASTLLINADEDRPPLIEFYVGRDWDLAELENADSRVTYISGIGGQGKSVLAASLFNSERSRAYYSYRIWRDCKEKSEKFEDHLINLIERLNDGRVLAAELSKQPIGALADLFSLLTTDLRLLVIFDNVDHYVDLEAGTLAGPAGDFVESFLSNRSEARLVFTCRPSIRHPREGVLSKRLQGLSLVATHELFRLRRASASTASLERAHSVTSGHAFWLDLLAAQVAKRAPQIQLDDLLDSISSGRSEIPDTMLRSIWQSLREREQIVLQALAETLRPTSALQLSDYVGSLRFNQMSKAIRTLRDLNLLVVKSLDGGEEGFELHPVIRAFIRGTFQRAERVVFIEAILRGYLAFFGVHIADLKRHPMPGTILQWLEGAELCINAGRYLQAFERLDEVRTAIRRREPPGEYVRVVGLLLSSVGVSELPKFPQFDAVFKEYDRFLVNLGRTESASEALGLYFETLVGKDARYINYCDMQAYLHWRNGNYPAAIKWGTEGADLKRGSGVDTRYTSEHTLALAQRDSGAIDPALEHFLGGATIDEVIDPEKLDVDRGGPFYRNIGRCLHLMGQVDPALICYGKSAHLIGREHGDNYWENQAYIMQWIGELLLTRGEAEAALSLLVAALNKWVVISPPKATRLDQFIFNEFGTERSDWPNAATAEKFTQRWISHATRGS